MDRYLLETIVNEWHKVHTRKKNKNSNSIHVLLLILYLVCIPAIMVHVLSNYYYNMHLIHWMLIRDTFRIIFFDAKNLCCYKKVVEHTVN